MLTLRTRSRLGAALLTIAALVLAGGLAVKPEVAVAASAADFEPGYIISDANFYNGSALTAASIQSFLNAKVATCRAGYTCLKDYRQTTTNRAADAMCAAYTGAANETAATIIAKVGSACGISQKVLLVLLQKEQGLVTDTWPTTGQYQKATGFACPDTAACDPSTLGFYNQVYKAAWQFKRYGNPPGTSQSFTWIPVGKVSAIMWNEPKTGCGAGNVLVQNKATAALYYYTPYQPNAAALANLYGTGDACSAYGNRNFWAFYSDWFGSPTSNSAPIGNYESATLSTTAFTVSGWTIDPSLVNASINVQISWNTPSGTSTTTVAANRSRPDVGNAYPNAGAAHGFTASVPLKGDGQYSACITAIAIAGNPSGNTSLGCKTLLHSSALNGSPTSSRVQGADRFDTSVAVSKAAYPTAGVAAVYIASGVVFADAIAAGPAAAKEKGPLLLTLPTGIPASVTAEIKRLKPQKIVIVGGTSAISANVQKTLAGIQKNVVRIAGADRFDTSRKLARYAFPTAVSASFASGLSFPDALSAASASGVKGRPVVLVTGWGAPDAATASFIRTAKLSAALVVGGASAIAPSFDKSLKDSGITVTRIGGSDRFETGHLVNSNQFTTASTAYVASGIDFPDALSGSVLAAKNKAPLFVAPSWCLPRSVGNDIARMKVSKVVLIGGPASLTPDVAAFRPC
ncbi:cell wall-binding repeat-containing protein [Leifsonia sp. F6_8S_P_1B]|uniref:Cell wall-binding repeat-containing protein n=1 Tax=Leifsonia williamsii TaxID=3035919 RepID=A0ABT8KCA2_9MICO|nr:cell wall-binding repeat-containing protein [Leifsonia williamsii]MDN4614416.1 cell wall-binding repeat-containing protein [Leifsonia williamsii]